MRSVSSHFERLKRDTHKRSRTFCPEISLYQAIVSMIHSNYDHEVPFFQRSLTWKDLKKEQMRRVVRPTVHLGTKYTTTDNKIIQLGDSDLLHCCESRLRDSQGFFIFK